MALQRISFANDAGGSGEYIVPKNPYAVEGWEVPRTLTVVEHNILGDYPVEVEGKQDTQVRTLRWRYRSDMTDYTGMYTTLKGYEFTGSNYKWFKDGDLGSFTSWTKMKIISVTRTVVPKYYRGKILYELVLTMELA